MRQVSEQGVKFISPYDGITTTVLTPEHSMAIQQAIGADIIMYVSMLIR